MQTATYPPSRPLAWLNWSIAVSFVILVFGFQTGYAITNAKMAQSLLLTASDIGLIGSMYTVCFAVSQLASGSLLDRLGAQRVLPVACTLLTIGVFCFAYSTSLVGLLLAQVLIAMGASFGFIGAGFVGGMWFAPERYGFMFACVQFVASLSAFFSQQVLNHVLVKLPWDWVINGIGMLGLCVLLLMFLWLRDPPHYPGHKEGIQSIPLFAKNVLHDVATVIRAPQMWRIMLIGACSFGVMLCVGVVWGPMLLLSHGLLETEANTAVSLSWLGLAFGAPIFAWWGQYAGQEKNALTTGLMIQLICIVFLIFVDMLSVGICYGLMWLWGFAAGASMLPFALAAKQVNSAYAGTSAALVNGSQFLTAGILMSVPGSLLTHGFSPNIQAALIILPILLVVAILLMPGLKCFAATELKTR